MSIRKTEEGLGRVKGVSGLSLTILNFTIGAGIFVLPAIVGSFRIENTFSSVKGAREGFSGSCYRLNIGYINKKERIIAYYIYL